MLVAYNGTFVFVATNKDHSTLNIRNTQVTFNILQN